jgi:protein-L-isoaspartate(D-aspartate) O-methyltransferase
MAMSRRALGLTVGVLFAVSCSPRLPAEDGYQRQRAAMVEAIAADVVATSEYLGQSTLDPRVLTAMATVPRHEFVPPLLLPAAYANRPLPIGHGQTISQPYIVALMTDLLGLEQPAKVFELGTGSGYQAAVLAQLGHEVYTLEIIEPLGEAARSRLARLGYDRVHARVGDGYYGWSQAAPFDAIVVTAAASHVPPPLLAQLKPGGRMVIPVGGRFTTQQLVLIQKDEVGEFTTRQMLPVMFVPLTGQHD